MEHIIYLDDIILFTPSFDLHLKRLHLVFQKLREANLKLKPSKCRFVHKSVNFLGHVISAEGILPNPEKLLFLSHIRPPQILNK